MITRYGYDVVAIVAVLVVIGSSSAWVFLDSKELRFGIIGILLVVLVFTLGFFRDPERAVPDGDNLVLSPADGKVVLIKDVEENEFLHGSGIQVSVFMSPVNVHVNRFPMSGTIAYFRHIPGKYLVAFDEKSSTSNERTHIGIEKEGTRVLFRQIAGFVARRIVAPLKVGDTAVSGRRFGMIRFGSRVDVVVPKEYQIKVKVGDKAVAGETVLAVFS